MKIVKVLVQQVCARMHKHENTALKTHYQHYNHIIWRFETVYYYNNNLNDCTLPLELGCDDCATCKGHERLFIRLQLPQMKCTTFQK